MRSTLIHSLHPTYTPLGGPHAKTQVERLLLAMKLLGLRATTSDHVLTNPVGGWKEWCGEPQHHDIGIIHGLDWCQAERVRVQGPADGYTDGSTLGAALDRPRCGWGGVLVDKEVRLTAGVAPRWQGSGPITRPATNYHAEAMALLQTILKVNPTDPLHLFSDNASCVLACQNTGNDLTAATMAEMPASSTVMRLGLMIRARLQRGTETTVSWVHSHVDDPDRLQPKASTFRCACNDPNTLDAPVVPRCKPNHAAHLGNAFADTLAEEGVDQQREEHGADDISRTLKMRVSFESVRRGSSEQFSKLVEASVSEALLNSAIDRGKVRAQRLDLFLRASDPASRRHAMKTAVGGDSDLSERFLTRLWVGVLPTYSIIAKRIHSGSDNMTRAMYTPVGADDPIVDPCGTCRLCDSGKPETLQHILCECENPALHLIRVHAKDRVHADWQHSVLEPFPNPMEWEHESDWLPHWMWLGATPARLNTAIANTGQDPMPLLVDLRAAQDTLMSATHKMWETRNTLVLAWEESMGAKDTKAHVQRTGWTRSTAQTGERGRTRLAGGELSVATRRARERQQETAEVSAAILRPGETREQLARARKRDRTNRNHLEDLGTFQAAAARVPTPHDGPGHSAYDHNVKPRRRTPVVDRAMALGAGTFLRVRWPNENGRGVWWYGRVDHLVPRPDATAYHVIQYEGEDEMYRHDLTSGDTQYDVLQQEKPEPDDWCQQGQGTCTCGGDANHEHLWYEPNRLGRAACHCEFCMYGAPVPASVPAGDYTGDGTGAAGELDTEIVEPSGGSDSDSADDTHSHVADDSGGEISDIPSEPNSESVNSGGEIDDTIDDPDPRISRIRSNNGPCRAGDGRARATSGRHEDRVHISAGKKPRRSARNKRKLSPERQSAEGFTEARQSEERATQVTQTLKKALRRLVDVGRITVSSMRLINAPPASGGEVEAEIPEHVEALLAQGKRVTARILREKFRCRHWNAGGFPKDLTTAINNILLDFALRDKLMPPTQRGMMSVFSGGQSDARPAAEVGLDVLHVDWQNPYVVGPGNEVRVNRPTDVRQAPRGDIVSWVCKREKCSAKTMALLALAVPCHTWTTMEHVNRHRVDAGGNPAPCNYRGKTGAPTTHDPEKAKEAKEQQEMAENSVISALDWIMDGAVQGEQRYVYLENGAYGLLRFEEFMDWLPPQQVCHYCMYEVVLGSGINYTAKKATGIWTNISGWKPRVCNHPPGSHAAQLGGKGEKRAPTFPTLGIAPYAAKRWTPEELHLELMQAMRLG